ncbi:MAG: sensor histidine kinase [Acidimicrobiales bacterium]
MRFDDDRRILLGRVLAASSVAFGISGVVALAAIGRWDFLIGDFIVHNAVLAVGFGVLGWVVLPVQPRNGTVWALSGSAFFGGIYVAADSFGLIAARSSIPDLTWEVAQEMSLAELPTDAAILTSPGAWSWIPAFFLMLTAGLLLFPDGRHQGARWRWLFWFGLALIVVVTLAQAWVFRPPSSTVSPDALFEDYPGAAGAVVANGFFLLSLVSILSVVSLVVRYRQSSGDVRRQILLIALGGALLTAALVFGGIVDAVWIEASSVFDVLVLVGVTLLVLSFAIAILKYRLYELDVVISKTVTYVSLAAIIATVYVGLVVGVSGVVGGGSAFGLPIVASVLIAMAFQPVRRRLERWANRLVYGERATPYEVLVGFSMRSAELSDEELIAVIPQLIVDGTGVEMAAVWTRTDDGFRTAAAWPADTAMRFVAGADDFVDPEADHSVPVFHDGEMLGGISLVKPVGESVTSIDEGLLSDLASGMGLAVRNARLTGQLRTQVAELEASRERVLAAADEARRTFENDLDAGPQQDLVAVKVKLGPARMLAERAGAEKASALLAQLEHDAGAAIKAVRDFAGGIYPPLLEAEGLAVAMAQQLHAAAIPVSITAEGVARYPREVEAAVYFSVLEALQNTAKYAQATEASVTIEATDRSLTFEVRDDGRGFDAEAVAGGAGLTGMADRLDTVGGTLRIESTPGKGTVVEGSLPVQALASA